MRFPGCRKWVWPRGKRVLKGRRRRADPENLAALDLITNQATRAREWLQTKGPADMLRRLLRPIRQKGAVREHMSSPAGAGLRGPGGGSLFSRAGPHTDGLGRVEFFDKRVLAGVCGRRRDEGWSVSLAKGSPSFCYESREPELPVALLGSIPTARHLLLKKNRSGRGRTSTERMLQHG